jgi:hypothetical protein
MDVGMQVSFSETFNIVTADFVSCNIPIVVSTDIRWMPDRSQSNPTSVEDIVDKLDKIRKFSSYSTWSNSKALKSYNKMAAHAWISSLNKLI